MTFTKKFKEFKNFYIFFFISILFINTIVISKLYAISFKITDIEVSEDFNLGFSKKKVFDKAFREAFVHLTSVIVTSEDKSKIEKTSLKTIKSLIDSFEISDEQFIDNKYFAKFNVDFNKRNTYDFLESKNVFPSVPKKLDVLILPILINNDYDNVIFFSENPFYNKWNVYKNKYHLLNYILPTEDIEDTAILKKNIKFIEEYKFDEIIKKYNLKDYVIVIIYQNKNEIKVLSKLQFNNTYKIFNENYENLNVSEEGAIAKLIFDLKNKYEDNWKKLNLINTSIKLPLSVVLQSKNYEKTQLFEQTLEKLDFVSTYQIMSFDSKNILYKVIYNGSPDKFFNQIKNSGLIIEKENQNWVIK